MNKHNKQNMEDNFVIQIPNVDNLQLREAIIILTTLLDVSLSDLLVKRLRDDKEEITKFLGLDNNNGKAPLVTFGSKIVAAYLLGVISNELKFFLRELREVRNICAHDVEIDVSQEKFKTQVEKAIDSYYAVINNILKNENNNKLKMSINQFQLSINNKHVFKNKEELKLTLLNIYSTALVCLKASIEKCEKIQVII